MAKRKKEIKVKEPVRIREKVLGDGTISLYLDMYHKGNRTANSPSKSRPSGFSTSRRMALWTGRN